ncbi:hypothetical protein MRS44_013370 [Fusarium solani]|uniref:uncharacterized protein n=1 Tax=Fusarium solani TaxID=169388 RepID=UPI0032C3DF7E|nr:hypothetical protein MRS44_013370 [Fusarium solani]
MMNPTTGLEAIRNLDESNGNDNIDVEAVEAAEAAGKRIFRLNRTEERSCDALAVVVRDLRGRLDGT